MFPFQPFKDNKPWRRLLSVAAGLACFYWALTGIDTSHIVAFRNSHFYVAKEPAEFWLVVTMVIVLGIAFIYRGIRGKRDAS